MAEFVVKVPKALSKEAKKIEHDVNEYVCMEEKKKKLSLFLEDAMQGAGQLTTDEVTRIGREAKKGRAKKLKDMGMI